jgi:hypothetical protein
MDRSPTKPMVRPVAVTAMLTGLGGAAWLFAVAPAFVDFGVAVAAAFVWCFLVEAGLRPRLLPDPGPDGGVPLNSSPSGTVLEADARVSRKEPLSVKAA